MRVTFAKTKAQHDVVTVERGGATRRFPLHRYESAPPELLHYAVETAAGLRHAFWGMVADGVPFEDAYQGGRGVRGSLGGRDTRQLRLAEVLVAGFNHESWMGTDDDAYANFVRDACAQAGLEFPDWLDDDRIGDLRGAVTEATSRWHSLSETGSITVHYPSRL